MSDPTDPDAAPPVSEAELHGWVDGRLDPARRAAVVRHLALDPALQRRVADWAAHAAELRQVVRAAEDAERQAILLRLARPARPSRLRAAAVAAATLLAAAVGGAAGWTVRGGLRMSEVSRLGVEAAATYRILGAGGAAAEAMPVADRAALRTAIATRLGRRVPVPDLASAGYRLLGGQVVAAIYGPAALLRYGDADGNSLTVYLQPMAIGEPAAMRPVGTAALNGYAWIDDRIGYTVLSEDGRERTHQVADRLMADLAR